VEYGGGCEGEEICRNLSRVAEWSSGLEAHVNSLSEEDSAGPILSETGDFCTVTVHAFAE